jgi:hypothetical protein
MTVRIKAKAAETVRYVGANIGYVPGIPMQDMDAATWNELDESLRVWGIESGMYQIGGPEQAADDLAEIKGEVTPAAAPVEPAAAPEQEAKSGRSKGAKEGD